MELVVLLFGLTPSVPWNRLGEHNVSTLTPMGIKENIAFEHLEGRGIEFGALTNPLPVNKDRAEVVYADRLSRSESIVLFPELGDVAKSIVEPDLIIDFNDAVALRSLASENFDFLIANHFIEHLANPIRFLVGCSEILKSGGMLFLTVPDKDRTFDKNRKLTSNHHLWRDFKRGESAISNSHLREFLKSLPLHTPPDSVIHYFKENNLPLEYYDDMKLPLNPFKRQRLFNWHRERSIHVHVWNRESFDRFLNWIIAKLELGLEIKPTHSPVDVEGEMIYVLNKMS